MSEEGDKTEYFDTQYHTLRLFCKSIHVFGFQKIMNSFYLDLLLRKLFMVIFKYLPNKKAFKRFRKLYYKKVSVQF